jgi:hypothetical protein
MAKVHFRFEHALCTCCGKDTPDNDWNSDGQKVKHLAETWDKVTCKACLNSKEGQKAFEQRNIETVLAALEDIASNFDHEHHSKGQVSEDECDGPGQCRVCTANTALEQYRNTL